MDQDQLTHSFFSSSCLLLFQRKVDQTIISFFGDKALEGKNLYSPFLSFLFYSLFLDHKESQRRCSKKKIKVSVLRDDARSEKSVSICLISDLLLFFFFKDTKCQFLFVIKPLWLSSIFSSEVHLFCID